MRLRSFIVSDMAEAMTLVRREMGPDALILSARPTEGGNLEVRAASEAGDARAPEPELAPDEPPAPAEPDPGIREALIYHGAGSSLSQSLAEAAASLGEDAPGAALALALEARCRFRPVTTEERHPVMLIGAGGAGKSSACAKLAARAVLAGRETRLICADSGRAGAREQAERYAETVYAQFDAVDGPEEAGRCLRLSEDSEFVVIDSGAINLHDRAEREALSALIAATDAEPVLVLDGATAPGEAAMLSLRARALGATRVIVSKLDAVSCRGALPGLIQSGALAFAQYSATPYLGGGFAPASPLRLSRFLLDNSQADRALDERRDQGEAA